MKLINSDCIIAMKEMPDDSIDSIVTDPPYELGFMGKSWDSTGIANSVEMWSEALRVLKPGGHLIAFSGSRTYHRIAVAIEDAGFEIRDQIMWVYGSGFPKSHNISKGIDKAAGAERTEVIGARSRNVKPFDDENGWNENNTTDNHNYTAPATPAAKQWDGWGTALKPAHEPMVLARKPVVGTVVNNVLTYGVGGLNIDSARVSSDDNFDSLVGRPIQKLATRLKGETNEEYKSRVLESPGQQAALAKLKELGRFPANFIHDGSDEVVALFPYTKTDSIKPYKHNNASTIYGGGRGLQLGEITGSHNGDSGSAARFFYCAKVSKRDRNEGLEGFPEIKGGSMSADDETREGRPTNHPVRANHHPTVKPTTLMQYLVRLVTPPGGTVLDPFMGSGSTGKACAYEGFEFVGIDQSAEYVEIAKARIDYALLDNKPDEYELPF